MSLTKEQLRKRKIDNFCSTLRCLKEGLDEERYAHFDEDDKRIRVSCGGCSQDVTCYRIRNALTNSNRKLSTKIFKSKER
jgi:hypothetical protein